MQRRQRCSGYTKFVAQGGDWGAIITDVLATQAPPGLLGIHSNMPGVIPPDIDKAAQAGAPTPSGLSADERSAYEHLKFVYAKGVGYGYQMGLRPQTLYGIADSPSAWSPICLTTTRGVWSSSHGRLTGTPKASHETTFLTTSL